MAAPCGVITVAALVVTAAKKAYDWPGQNSFAVDMIDRNGKLAGKLKSLIDDIWVVRDWTDEFEKTYGVLRTEISGLPEDSSPRLKDSIRNNIQTAIIERENPASWWKGP